MNLSLTENLRFGPEEGSAPWLDGEPDWTPRMLRSALVWLALRLGKSILKLTDKDYRENGLESLLKRFGSAYDVNIRVFNDLQHTITGWPGANPMRTTPTARSEPRRTPSGWWCSPRIPTTM